MHRSIVMQAVVVAAFAAAAPEARADARGVSLAPEASLTRDAQQAITPTRALERLREGNRRFVEGRAVERDHAAQVAATASGQHPYAVILGCIDSRVPPEIVFDQGIGDVFTARIAGNFLNTDILGSIEFATAVAGAKLVVVLGHTECGAVKGACDGVELENLTHTLANLAPAIYAVDGVKGPRNSKNPAFVAAVTRANVEQTVQNVLDRSRILRDLHTDGELLVVGAIHDVGTGEVTFLP